MQVRRVEHSYLETAVGPLPAMLPIFKNHMRVVLPKVLPITQAGRMGPLLLGSIIVWANAVGVLVDHRLEAFPEQRLQRVGSVLGSVFKDQGDRA